MAQNLIVEVVYTPPAESDEESFTCRFPLSQFGIWDFEKGSDESVRKVCVEVKKKMKARGREVPRFIDHSQLALSKVPPRFPPPPEAA